MHALRWNLKDNSEFSSAQNASCKREICFGSLFQERVVEESSLLKTTAYTFPGLLEYVICFICVTPASDIEYNYRRANTCWQITIWCM